MKTFKHLYPQIYTFANLEQAFRKARRGKRHKPNVAAFECDLDLELLALQDALQEESYRPGGYRHFTIYDGKPRRISAAPFRDRVVHHALGNVTEPIWEARFIYDSYACRAGKGTHAALDRCTQFARRYPYVLQADIVQFFPSVDHDILRSLLARRIACPPTLRLADTIIASGQGIHAARYEMQWFPGDNLLAAQRPRGLPIGNQTSQFWANVYLHELDQFVKQSLHCRAYLRYMDDFVLFANNKADLHRWREAIVSFLAERLRLQLHPRKSVIFPSTTGINFCGWHIYPTHRRLRRSSIRRFVRRFRHQRAAYRQGDLPLEDLHISVRSWIAHAAHGDTWRLRERLFTDYPIRAPR